MTYCVNPDCSQPQNPDNNKFCHHCSSPLLLKERYRPIQLIGQGGFGRTFLAIDEDIPSQPQCVVKQLYLQGINTESCDKAIALFRQEAVRLDRLGKHPQIPALLAHFEQDRQLYLIQELIAGQTLAEELERQGTFTEEKIWELLRSLVPILNFIHQRRVIHRDIKPSNIMRRDNNSQLVLIDFGVAKLMTGTSLQRTGTIVGSAAYVAPEQLRGKAMPASDLYSLGVTCIHLLTNISSPLDLYNVVDDRWEWRDYLPPENNVSDRLGYLLDKLLQYSLAKRYQTAADLLQTLKPPTKLKPASKPSKQVRKAISSPPQPATTWLKTVTYVKTLLKLPSGNNLLASEVGVDYKKLTKFLLFGQWKAADEETRVVLCQALGKRPGSYLLSGDIEKIPCQDLQTIDRLWVKYSSGHFGFSVQTRIYWQVGEDYAQFCDRLGWPVYNPHSTNEGLRYSKNAPVGHLPSRQWVGGTQWWRHARAIALKLDTCGIS